MERFGLVGLPNAGKSSLYNALTGGGALAAPYAFATKDPNVGVAKVPDHRLDALAEMSKSRNVVHAAVQVVDIGGLVEGASKGEGLGNRFLGGIREVDAIVFVLRAFEDDDVPGPTDPLEHLRIVELELALADLETVEAQLARRQKAAKARPQRWPRRWPRSRPPTPRWPTAARSTAPASTPSSARSCGPYFLLTNKPVLAVVNVGEDELDDLPARGGRGPGRAGVGGRRDRGARACRVQLEAEAAQLDERRPGRDARGARPRRGRAAPARPLRVPPARPAHVPHDRRQGEPGVDRSGPGPRRPSAPGVIHTDLQRGFIRAEVIHWDDLLEIGSWNKAKELGQAARSRARTTRSSTATCWRSASTSDGCTARTASDALASDACGTTLDAR